MRDVELEDLDRKRFPGRRNPDFDPVSYVNLSGRQLFRVAFAIRRVPWRLAIVEVETDFAIPGMPREDDVALVAWVGGLTTIIREDPPSAEVLGPDDGTRGDNSPGRLLQPEPLEAVAPRPGPRISRLQVAPSNRRRDVRCPRTHHDRRPPLPLVHGALNSQRTPGRGATDRSPCDPCSGWPSAPSHDDELGARVETAHVVRVARRDPMVAGSRAEDHRGIDHVVAT